MAGLERRHPVRVALAAAWLLLAAPALHAAETKPQPLAPQPAVVQPGLIPVYYRNVVFDSVPEVIRYGGKAGRGEAGAPLADINATSNAGSLWNAGTKRHYGVRIDGLIRLEAGSTSFSARSNDGFRLILGGATVLEDADVHVERLTAPATVTVAAAGWYPLRIWYFQKQGGATLELLWQPPGATAAVPVPATAFGHP